MSNLEQWLRIWRTKQLQNGLQPSTIDELESHLLDVVQELTDDHGESTAFTMALNRLGDVEALAASGPMPVRARIATGYIWVFGLAMIANELLGFGNGSVDPLALFAGLATCYAGFQIGHLNRRWLISWMLISWGLLFTLELFFVVCVMGLLVHPGVPMATYTGFGLAAILITVWQLQTFHKRSILQRFSFV